MNKIQTLELLDPTTLTVDTNVRKDAALTPSFISSIRELGVLEPVVGHRNEDGRVHVLMGQRRTLGAIEAGRATIPVMVIDSPDEAERIVTQVVENIQRTELGQGDEATAYHQLSLIGISAAAIAKQTGKEKSAVEKALKAKSTETGSDALAAGRTIDQALALAEFEGDTDATEELESVIADEPEYLAHALQKLTDNRDSEREFAELLATLESKGTVIVEEAGNYEDSENIRVAALNRPDGEPLVGHLGRNGSQEWRPIHLTSLCTPPRFYSEL